MVIELSPLLAINVSNLPMKTYAWLFTTK
jgi:hypothetical protein